jgi:DNA-binding PadR family transcriptional regulator
MPRKDALTIGELNDSQFYILAALVVPRHGYTTLRQLVDAGLLERCESDGTHKVYVITADGRIRLNNEIARKQAMVEFAQRALQGGTP